MKFYSVPKSYSRHVFYSETDAMQVVHHSNYIKYCEEARVSWIKSEDLKNCHWPEIDLTLAVLECELKYYKPLRFDEVFFVHISFVDLRSILKIQYQIKNSDEETVALARTTHSWVDKSLTPRKPPKVFLSYVERFKTSNFQTTDSFF